MILSAISSNLDKNMLAAALPLLADSKIEAFEWSFDALRAHKNIPLWFVELLSTFSHNNVLLGHGIYFSLFSGKWHKEHVEWLNHLKKVTTNFTFDHITEHFGFMLGEDFHKGAPMAVPLTETTLAIGQDRLKRISQICQCPVGLENLAFAFTSDDVKIHGEFLERLVEPINGFIILDLHNVYCQSHNFDVSIQELIRLYPLHLVREIHISGGSWHTTTHGDTIRRDTHDDAVPLAVFEALEYTLPLCEHLKYVTLEQVGPGLITTSQQTQFQADYLKMQAIIEQFNKSKAPVSYGTDFLPPPIALGEQLPLESQILQQQQNLLAEILFNSSTVEEARNLLKNSNLKGDWYIEKWPNNMLEAAIDIAKKWM